MAKILRLTPTLGIERTTLADMQADSADAMKLLGAVLFIVRHGEDTGLGSDEVAALRAVVEQAHAMARTLAGDLENLAGCG